MSSVSTAEVPAFFQRYIDLVVPEDLSNAIASHGESFQSLLATLSDDDWSYSYAPGKWTVKDLVQHMIDTERILSYRGLRVARGDRTELPGFDEEAFAAAAGANDRTPAQLIEELQLVQSSVRALFQSFSPKALQHTALVNGASISAGALVYITVGHSRHHEKVLRDRYGFGE